MNAGAADPPAGQSPEPATICDKESDALPFMGSAPEHIINLAYDLRHGRPRREARTQAK